MVLNASIYLGLVWVFTDESKTIEGNIDVHAHDSEAADLTLSTTKCITFGPGGGVDNCDRTAQHLSLYCPTGCKP